LVIYKEKIFTLAHSSKGLSAEFLVSLPWWNVEEQVGLCGGSHGGIRKREARES
jgi:hypothetical protein